MTADIIIETLAPYFIVLSIRIFLKMISSKMGPMMLIRKRFRRMLEEFINSVTGFDISAFMATPKRAVMANPKRFPSHMRVRVIAMYLTNLNGPGFSLSSSYVGIFFIR